MHACMQGSGHGTARTVRVCVSLVQKNLWHCAAQLLASAMVSGCPCARVHRTARQLHTWTSLCHPPRPRHQPLPPQVAQSAQHALRSATATGGGDGPASWGAGDDGASQGSGGGSSVRRGSGHGQQGRDFVPSSAPASYGQRSHSMASGLYRALGSASQQVAAGIQQGHLSRSVHSMARALHAAAASGASAAAPATAAVGGHLGGTLRSMRKALRRPQQGPGQEAQGRGAAGRGTGQRQVVQPFVGAAQLQRQRAGGSPPSEGGASGLAHAKSD